MFQYCELTTGMFIIYEDDGDGFAYRTGGYLITRLEAARIKKRLTVTLFSQEGQWKAPERTLRIASVANGKIQYSAWKKGNTATMKIK